MKLSDIKPEHNISPETLDLIKQIVQGETDSVRTEYSNQIKDLKAQLPKQKTEAEIEIENRLKALEEREKAVQEKENLDNFVGKFTEKGLPKQLAKYFYKQGVEDVETYLNTISNDFNEAKLNSSYVPNEHKTNKTGITKEDFAKMNIIERTNLYNTNKALYDALTK